MTFTIGHVYRSPNMASIALVTTAQKFRMPEWPKRCNMRRYHVWRVDTGALPRKGQRCQCCRLAWTRLDLGSAQRFDS